MRFNWTTQLIFIILLAILVWVVVFNLNYNSFELDVPIQIINLDKTLAINENLTASRITVRSRVSDYAKLKTGAFINAVLDFNKVNSLGQHHLQPQITVHLKNVQIVNYRPQIFDVTLVPKVEASVKLIADPIGFPTSGYSLSNIDIVPQTIKVFGPSRIINSETCAFVSINVDKKKNSFSASGQPEIRNALGQKLANVSFLPTQVMVSVQIKKGENFKTLGLEPTFVNELPSGYWLSAIEFDPPALTIAGDAKILESINSLVTTPIDLTSRSNNFIDKVSVTVPPKTILLGMNLINVKIKIGTSSNNRQLILLPSYTNITEGFSVTSVTPPTVTVILSGSPAKLAELNRSNALLDLDLRGSLSGINTVNINSSMFKIPDGVEVASFTPQSLEITLVKN